jgi:hypothetical protein
MTTSEYLLNAAFVLLVLRQARERELDRRSVIVPLMLMLFVGSQYLHALPTAGNDLVFIVLLAIVGLTLGVLGGFATQVRAGERGVALARVGWIAGGLLVLGIGARMAFAFAVGHGFEDAVRSFSIAHQIGAEAWPAALVLMALVEVGSRIAVVQVRGHRLAAALGLRLNRIAAGPFRRAGARSIVCLWISPGARVRRTRRRGQTSGSAANATCCGRWGWS